MATTICKVPTRLVSMCGGSCSHPAIFTETLSGFWVKVSGATDMSLATTSRNAPFIRGGAGLWPTLCHNIIISNAARPRRTPGRTSPAAKLHA